jgi:hypothetical protein
VKSRLLGILSLLVLVLALTACDGSSGSSSSSSSGAKGAVAAAPMQLAKVFGLSAEGAEVLIGTTNNRGAFTANSNTSKLQFPAVVWSVGGWNVNDDPTDASKEFKGTLKGVMASADSAVYLTPANSLVAAFFEKSGNLAEAQQQVESLLKNEMGLKMTDPLGNPLTDLNESEIVAKSLMHLIGAGDENNAASMEKFSKTISDVAEAMNTGMTFTEVLKVMPESPFFGHTDTLCNCVEDEMDAIVAEAKASLGDLGDLTELEDNAKITDTSTYPIALEFDGLSSTEKASGTQGAVVIKTFKAVVTKADGNAVVTQTLHLTSIANGVLNDGTADMVVGVDSDVPAAQDVTFTVAIPADATFPYTASFTLETVESDDTLPTFSRTYTITFIGADEFAVKEVAYNGDKLFAFATPSTDDGKIAEGATASIAADSFKADVELVNSIDESLVDGNMDVRFIAPAGLAFNDSSENSDIVTVESFTKSGTTYTATPDAAYSFIAKDDVDAGFKTVRIQVLDQDGETIAQTAKDIVFVPEDQKKNLTRANLTEKTISNAIPAVGKLPITGISLDGSYRTWEKEADPAKTTGGLTSIPADSKVILMSKTGDKVFVNAMNELVDRIDITVTMKDDFTFESSAPFAFDYYYNNANDDIKMVFMLDPLNDPNNNIESSNVLKLRFDPAP